MRPSFQDSQDVLQILRSDKQGGLIVVCGQAVNFWAERYLAEEPRLKDFRPFTSRDIDVLGNIEEAAKVALSSGANLKRPPKQAPTPVAANLSIESAGRIRLVQFLYDVPGVKRAEIVDFSFPFKTSEISIRIADPIATLTGKVYNLITFDQKGRFDQKHFDILKLCVPVFIEKQIEAVERESADSRGTIKHLERLISVSLSTKAKELGRRIDVDWLDFIPRSRIERARELAVNGFRSPAARISAQLQKSGCANSTKI
jgi:hypothetical protein